MTMAIGIPDTEIGKYLHRIRLTKDEDFRILRMVDAMYDSTLMVIDPVVGMVLLEQAEGQWFLWLSNASCLSMYGNGRQGGFYSFDGDQLPSDQMNLQKTLFWDLICRWTESPHENLPAPFLEQLQVSKPQLQAFLQPS